MSKKNRAERRRAAAAKGNAPAAVAATQAEAPKPENLWTKIGKWISTVTGFGVSAAGILAAVFAFMILPRVEITPTVERDPSGGGHYFVNLINGGDAAPDQFSMVCIAMPTGFRDYLKDLKTVEDGPPVAKTEALTKNVRALFPVSKCSTFHYGEKEAHWTEPYGYVLLRLCYKPPFYQWGAGDDVAAFRYDPSINRYDTLQVDLDHTATLFRDGTTQYCKHVFKGGKSVG